MVSPSKAKTNLSEPWSEDGHHNQGNPEFHNEDSDWIRTRGNRKDNK